MTCGCLAANLGAGLRSKRVAKKWPEVPPHGESSPQVVVTQGRVDRGPLTGGSLNWDFCDSEASQLNKGHKQAVWHALRVAHMLSNTYLINASIHMGPYNTYNV